jgi:hypothetical protein
MGKIIAFEPLPRQSEALRKRFAGRPNVTVHGCGLSNEDGRLTIYTPIYRGFVFDALSALRREDAPGFFDDGRFYFFDESNSTSRQPTSKFSVSIIRNWAGHPQAIYSRARARDRSRRKKQTASAKPGAVHSAFLRLSTPNV